MKKRISTMIRAELLLIVILVLVGTIETSDILSVEYDNKYNDNGMVDTNLVIRTYSEVKNLKIYIIQADTILDSTKGIFDSSSGPADDPPQVKDNGAFSYYIPSLKNGQYVKMRYVSVSNKKCSEIVTGKLRLTFEGGQNEVDLKINIPCEDDTDKIWKYISAALIILIIIVVGIIIYVRKRRGL